MAKKAATKALDSDTSLQAGEKVEQIPLSNIVADYSWNSRRNIGIDAKGGPESMHAFDNLVESIKLAGQDTPVIVRHGKNNKLTLVVGFRRYAALDKIFKDGIDIPGLSRGHIKAIVRDMTDARARALNGRENIARSELNAADMAYQIHEMSRPVSEGGEAMTDSAIANEIGVGQSYVSKLHRLYRNLKPCMTKGDDGKPVSVFDFWRDRPAVAKVERMIELSDYAPKDAPEDEKRKWREEKFAEDLGKATKTDKEKEAEKAQASFGKMATKAESFATCLGKLARNEYVSLGAKPDWFGLLVAAGIVKEPKDKPFKATERKSIVKVAESAYDAAFNEEEEEDEEETEDNEAE